MLLQIANETATAFIIEIRKLLNIAHDFVVLNIMERYILHRSITSQKKQKKHVRMLPQRNFLIFKNIFVFFVFWRIARYAKRSGGYFL